MRNMGLAPRWIPVAFPVLRRWVLAVGAACCAANAAQGAPTLGSLRTAGRGTDGVSLPVVIPDGTTAGDLLLATIAKDAGAMFATPAGWALVNAGVALGTNASRAIYHRIADSSFQEQNRSAILARPLNEGRGKVRARGGRGGVDEPRTPGERC